VGQRLGASEKRSEEGRTIEAIEVRICDKPRDGLPRNELEERMTSTTDAMETKSREKFRNAMSHLLKSHAKSASLLGRPLDSLSDEELETLESFAGRFSRAADIASKRLMRTLVLKDDPDFDGSARDLFDLCEKRGYIRSSADWLEIRKVRNLVAHEYEEDELAALYAKLHALTPLLVDFSRSI
jgi:Nucleotidyltransferase substrate binding protein like